MPPRSSSSGYTLTELLVVIVILALVAAAITPQIFGRFSSAKARTAQLQADTLAAAMDDFFLDVGRYPSTEEGPRALFVAPDGASGWRGPYVRSLRSLTDPWGLQYVIVPSDEPTRPPAIVSLGADGKDGGEGYDADITSS